MEILKEKLVLPTNRLFCDCYMFHSRHRMFNIFYGFFKDNHKKYGKFNYPGYSKCVSHFPIFFSKFSYSLKVTENLRIIKQHRYANK